MKWIKTPYVSVGDLVKPSTNTWSFSSKQNIGIVSKVVGEIAYVYWGEIKPRPINIRLLRVGK